MKIGHINWVPEAGSRKVKLIDCWFCGATYNKHNYGSGLNICPRCHAGKARQAAINAGRKQRSKAARWQRQLERDQPNRPQPSLPRIKWLEQDFDALIGDEVE